MPPLIVALAVALGAFLIIYRERLARRFRRRNPGSGAALLIGVALVALAAGCSRDSSQSINLPTTSIPEGTGMAAEFVGTFRGDAETGCVWLLPEQRDQKDYDPVRVAVLWPAGFSARTSPLRLYDAKGRFVAREGDPLRLGGGFVPAQAAEDTALGLGRCRVSDEVWITSEVVRAG